MPSMSLGGIDIRDGGLANTGGLDDSGPSTSTPLQEPGTFLEDVGPIAVG